MKRILILTAILVFSCSSDDSSDSSNQTFLERYGNTKWEIINGDDCYPNDKWKFSNSDLFLMTISTYSQQEKEWILIDDSESETIYIRKRTKTLLN